GTIGRCRATRAANAASSRCRAKRVSSSASVPAAGGTWARKETRRGGIPVALREGAISPYLVSGRTGPELRATFEKPDVTRRIASTIGHLHRAAEPRAPGPDPVVRFPFAYRLFVSHTE